jgi:DNA (cytosine-5)-methyltransferase 1
MGKSFNKGEWSEFYVFIKILHDKKIYLFDSHLNKTDSFYKVLKILRKESQDCVYIIKSKNILKISDDLKIDIKIENIKPYIQKILKSLKENKGATFIIEDIDNIFNIIQSNKVKVGTSYDKSDITLVIDNKDLLSKNIGFNIKSYIGNLPTLLNSSRATNFKYEIIGFNEDIDKVNNINTKNKIRDRLSYLVRHSKLIKFIGLDNDIFCKNLRLIDSLMPDIISTYLLNFFSGHGRKINEIFNN